MGIAHIPEDRNVYGIAGACSIKENLISDRYYKMEFIRKRLVDLSRKEDAAVLLISADLTELQTVSDKILVMLQMLPYLATIIGLTLVSYLDRKKQVMKSGG